MYRDSRTVFQKKTVLITSVLFVRPLIFVLLVTSAVDFKARVGRLISVQ